MERKKEKKISFGAGKMYLMEIRQQRTHRYNILVNVLLFTYLSCATLDMFVVPPSSENEFEETLSVSSFHIFFSLAKRKERTVTLCKTAS